MAQGYMEDTLGRAHAGTAPPLGGTGACSFYLSADGRPYLAALSRAMVAERTVLTNAWGA